MDPIRNLSLSGYGLLWTLDTNRDRLTDRKLWVYGLIAFASDSRHRAQCHRGRPPVSTGSVDSGGEAAVGGLHDAHRSALRQPADSDGMVMTPCPLSANWTSLRMNRQLKMLLMFFLGQVDDVVQNRYRSSVGGALDSVWWEHTSPLQKSGACGAIDV